MHCTRRCSRTLYVFFLGDNETLCLLDIRPPRAFPQSTRTDGRRRSRIHMTILLRSIHQIHGAARPPEPVEGPPLPCASSARPSSSARGRSQTTTPLSIYVRSRPYQPCLGWPHVIRSGTAPSPFPTIETTRPNAYKNTTGAKAERERQAAAPVAFLPPCLDRQLHPSPLLAPLHDFLLSFFSPLQCRAKSSPGREASGASRLQL